MDNNQITDLLSRMGVTPDRIDPFPCEEGEGFYNVWKIVTDGQCMVLKEAKGYELDTYRTFFPEKCTYAPGLFGSTRAGEKDYLLIEYIPGEDLRHCDRERLPQVLDSLIAMQKSWWNHPSPEQGYHYSQSLAGRKKRLKYLKDAQLETAYTAFLERYGAVPRTLCHDDLLPFNVLCSDDRAVLIDWEYGGILPYLASLARLIAHGEETEDAFFYMTEVDKAFAVDYYYTQFIQDMGIPYGQYQSDLRLFLFYEYCEWVYVGKKFNETATPRFQSYYQKAKRLASELGF